MTPTEEFKFQIYTFHNRVGDYSMRYTRCITVAIATHTRVDLMRGDFAGIGFACCSVLDLYKAVRSIQISTGRAAKDAHERQSERGQIHVDAGEENVLAYIEKIAERKARQIDRRRAQIEEKEGKTYEHVFNFDMGNMGNYFAHLSPKGAEKS